MNLSDFCEEEDRAAVYDPGAKVPVGICGGRLEIDFAETMKELTYLKDQYP